MNATTEPQPDQPVLPLDVTPVCPDGCGESPAPGRRLCPRHQHIADVATLDGLVRLTAAQEGTQ